MDLPAPMPPRLPQRAVVTGSPAPLLATFLSRLAAALDVPLVPSAELTGPDDLATLAAFDGWVTTGERYDARAVLLDRADLVVVVLGEEPGTLRSLMRRTVRRIRAEAQPEVDVAWVEALPATHPGLEVVRLVGTDAVEAWLSTLRVSG
ncbi:MAG TPA: hypothetical protein VNS46_04165 [Nocardioides sp.]|nr:hypothetical protein [Nocardioides sp.]